jgi:hypothetical protein
MSNVRGQRASVQTHSADNCVAPLMRIVTRMPTLARPDWHSRCHMIIELPIGILCKCNVSLLCGWRSSSKMTHDMQGYFSKQIAFICYGSTVMMAPLLHTWPPLP